MYLLESGITGEALAGAVGIRQSIQPEQSGKGAHYHRTRLMKLLSDLLYKTGIEELSGITTISIDKICFDSRQVSEGTLFVAVRGSKSDGHDFIKEVIAKGAVAVVCEEMPAEMIPGITFVRVRFFLCIGYHLFQLLRSASSN
jgi:hypothetical protein